MIYVFKTMMTRSRIKMDKWTLTNIEWLTYNSKVYNFEIWAESDVKTYFISSLNTV